jgi:hypothetical protein
VENFSFWSTSWRLQALSCVPYSDFFPYQGTSYLNDFATRVLNIYSLRLWPAICGNGCRLDKRTDVEIKKAGFSAVKLAHLEIYTSDNFAFKLIKHHIAGYATK